MIRYISISQHGVSVWQLTGAVSLINLFITGRFSTFALNEELAAPLHVLRKDQSDIIKWIRATFDTPVPQNCYFAVHKFVNSVVSPIRILKVWNNDSELYINICLITFSFRCLLIGWLEIYLDWNATANNTKQTKTDLFLFGSLQCHQCFEVGSEKPAKFTSMMQWT